MTAGPVTDPDESTVLRRWTTAVRSTGARVAVVRGEADVGVCRDEEVLQVGTGNAALLLLVAGSSSPPAVARTARAGTDDGWLRLQASDPLVDSYLREVC